MLNGVKRGLFSNEAGMGSAPNIAAAATPVPHHPSSQGFVQALGVFIDTIVICTCTALMILLSGVYVPGGELTGTQLTQSALAEHIGWIGPYFIAVAIFFFAFTSIIGNYSYSEMAMVYLGRRHTTGLLVLRVVVLLMVVWGALQAVATVFNTADASMGLMATINLIAIVALSGTVVKLTRDYFAQRAAGDRAALPRQGLSRARRPDRPHDLDAGLRKAPGPTLHDTKKEARRLSRPARAPSPGSGRPPPGRPLLGRPRSCRCPLRGRMPGSGPRRRVESRL